MRAGTTLRVPEGIELSAEFLAVLGRRFPNYILENFSEVPDYKHSYQKRVDSIYSAFQYLLDAYPLPRAHTPLTQATLKRAVDEYKAAYNGASESLRGLQDELQLFTSKVIGIICLAYNKSSSNAIELLNQAEQYALMTVGRNDLVTVTPVHMESHPEIKYFLQVDEYLAPYNKEILDELAIIQAENYPKTPDWFRHFETTEHHYKQAYFCNLPSEHVDIKRDFAEFLSAWGRIKETALDLKSDLQQIDTGSSPLPAWFQALPIHHQEMLKLLSNEWTISAIDRNLGDFQSMISHGEYQESLAQFIKIPQWYWVLSEHQQYFLEHLLKNKDSIEKAVSVLSSRNRRLPLPANWGVHSLWWLKKTEESEPELQPIYSGKYRSSHIATRDDLNHLPRAVQSRHVLANLSKVMEFAKPSQLVLFQTLVSPIEIPYFLSFFSELPDSHLDKMARAVIDDSRAALQIIRTNHPLNIAKYPLYTGAEDANSMAFILALRKYIPSVPGLNELINDYDDVLHSGVFTATFFDYSGRELFLSSLEQLLIVAVGGYSYGSCVSGKDRKAIELMHTDAMRVYYEMYGAWPKFRDTESNRSRFISIVADFFITHHHEELAGSNAPGSEGIKTPDTYFPADIAEEINRRLKNASGLKRSDKLASNNEIRVICRGSQFPDEDTLLCQLVASQLGDKQCKKLYQILFLIVGQQSLFTPAMSSWGAGWWLKPLKPSLPYGIQQIISLMEAKDARTMVMRVADIFTIVLQRSEMLRSRSLATQSLYNDLRCLLSFNEKDQSFLVDEMVSKWTILFEQSKKANCQSRHNAMLN